MEQTNDVKDRMNEVGDTGQEKLQAQATTVKAKAAEVGNRVATGAAAKTEQAMQVASDPDKRKAAQESAEERIRSNPLRAVAAAFAVGVKVGRMSKR